MTGKHEFDGTPPETATPTTPVEEQRAALAETVDALAAKADVPARVRNEAAFQADKLESMAQEKPGVIVVIAVGVVSALIVGIVVRRRGRRKGWS